MITGGSTSPAQPSMCNLGASLGPCCLGSEKAMGQGHFHAARLQGHQIIMDRIINLIIAVLGSWRCGMPLLVNDWSNAASAAASISNNEERKQLR